MSIVSVMLRSLVRLVSSLVCVPVACITTILYYSDHLPRNVNLERMVRDDLLDHDHFLFHLLINILRCL
ncbi:hypothetical protein GIB67_025892 [Kingdonia uniflora]|uniref:Uncharacterized protein n=1 Tax=Kingdonia uniflora TaxID=39325 RepID=A0A7J7LPK7_9MAGN|nr:hypothetical protein GIB67_025892 [Kingdonia uniflora]